MAIDAKPVHELLKTISEALTTAKNAFPDDAQSMVAPEDGISLLDIKNDLLLSYLQHLVFLILVRLKSTSGRAENENSLGKEVVKSLIELRAYLDRGVRPLEGRLRYQIDKVLRAADDAERSTVQKLQASQSVKNKKKSKKVARTTGSDSDVSRSGSDVDDGSEDEESDTDAEDDEAGAGPQQRDLVAVQRKETAANLAKQSRSKGRDEVYKPPRLNPVSMPGTTTRSREDLEDSRMARRRKNALLDEYVNEEHSSAPLAQPSIGSNNTILAQGRQHSALGSRDRNKERERLDYEERNFVRLPAVSKAERKKDKARQQREGRDMFGGEDWTGLGGLGDRIGRSVEGRSGKQSVLERRDKRKRDTQDLPRGDGVGMGESFEKRRKVMQGRMDRKKDRR